MKINIYIYILKFIRGTPQILGDRIMNLKVVGLFTGVGGIELGFEQAGFKTVWSNELDQKAAETFKLNFKTPLIVDDIHNIKADDIPDCDVIVGGFPCQAFSVAGYRLGFEDERGEVFFQMARIIKDKKPRVVFIENVKNLLSHDKGNTFKVIRETLESYGYYLNTLMLNASEYGNIPQNRERVYIIGFLNKEDFDNFNNPQPIPLTKSLFDVIDRAEKVEEKFYYTPEKYTFYDELEKEMKNPDTLYQWRRVYVRENKSNLSPTLTANMGTGGHNVPLLLSQNGIRKLTPKECFKLQGYPDNFKLPDLAQSHLYKQAGNSVCVPLIKRLAIEIKNAIDKTEDIKIS